MRTFSIRDRDGVMEINYSENSNKPPFRKFMITYNPKFSIGDNLENIKAALTGLPATFPSTAACKNPTPSPEIQAVHFQESQ